MFIQTRLRTFGITPNDNICFPVGTIFAVCGQYEKLGFPAGEVSWEGVGI
ncbi:MAG: hypothetical protein SRB1_01202 [Desulfobacteraceae bacterium Eth-SRB1]|nr:MAG: hypothetical protein SRB1_01202 [Desulfobacteraceae bacterium Eth-SRB1]